MEQWWNNFIGMKNLYYLSFELECLPQLRPLHTAKYLCSLMYWTARILDTNLHKKYYKDFISATLTLDVTHKTQKFYYIHSLRRPHSHQVTSSISRGSEETVCNSMLWRISWYLTQSSGQHEKHISPTLCSQSVILTACLPIK